MDLRDSKNLSEGTTMILNKYQAEIIHMMCSEMENGRSIIK